MTRMRPSPVPQHTMLLSDMADRVHGNMAAAGRAVPLPGQLRGDGGVVDPLARQGEQPRHQGRPVERLQVVKQRHQEDGSEVGEHHQQECEGRGGGEPPPGGQPPPQIDDDRCSDDGDDRADRLADTAAQVSGTGRRALTFSTDVADPDACTRLVALAMEDAPVSAAHAPVVTLRRSRMADGDDDPSIYRYDRPALIAAIAARRGL